METKDLTELKELALDIEAIIRKSFDNSFVKVVVMDQLSRPNIYVNFALGKDSSEWANGIIQNDPAKHGIHIWPKADKFEVECNVNSITAKPPVGSYLAYGRIKTGWRNFTGDKKTVLKRIDKYFEKLYVTMVENLDNMVPEHAALTKKKIIL